MRPYVLALLSALLLAPNLIPVDINGEPEYNGTERFQQEISHLQNIHALEDYVDRQAEMKGIPVYSPEYSTLLVRTVSNRFYHGFSHYSLSENWVAALGEKILGYGLASKVDPDDILKHPYAACSQQSLVVMAVLRKKGIPYRKVGFPHHYALEVFQNNHWYYFDPNMEPSMALNDRLHESWVGYNDNLKAFYSAAQQPQIAYQFGNGQQAVLGPVNEIPARNASLFHSATFILSKCLWCLPLLALAWMKKPKKGLYPVRPVNLNPVYRLPRRAPYYV